MLMYFSASSRHTITNKVFHYLPYIYVIRKSCKPPFIMCRRNIRRLFSCGIIDIKFQFIYRNSEMVTEYFFKKDGIRIRIEYFNINVSFAILTYI